MARYATKRCRPRASGFSLLGSIKRSEPHPKLVANAERVRQAQLGCFKAKDLVAELPTDVDDEQTRRHRENLARAMAAWESMPVKFRRDVFDRWGFDDHLPIADLA